MTASEDMLFTVPLYTFAEADRLGMVRAGTAKRWLVGYSVEPTVFRPPVSTAGSRDGVSFWDLIEVIVVGRLRKAGFSLPYNSKRLCELSTIVSRRAPVRLVALKDLEEARSLSRIMTCWSKWGRSAGNKHGRR